MTITVKDCEFVCKQIHTLLLGGGIPPSESIEIRRVYNRTWTLVELWALGLCKPTKDAHNRLSDLCCVCHKAAKAYKVTSEG